MSAVRAQMARDDEAWCLYVAVAPGRAAEWPRYVWPKGHRNTPTVGERDRALARLGFRRGAEFWDWRERELSNHRVDLFAAIEVLPE
ncbi:DUF6303 family protein [Streptomyces sp. NPDC088747]|uniref:DUF6303 family protein n=1 Tax=Streptomyces sp. NPDC088747 TaxID=3365886 RepID=UPI0037F342F0